MLNISEEREQRKFACSAGVAKVERNRTCSYCRDQATLTNVKSRKRLGRKSPVKGGFYKFTD